MCAISTSITPTTVSGISQLSPHTWTTAKNIRINPMLPRARVKILFSLWYPRHKASTLIGTAKASNSQWVIVSVSASQLLTEGMSSKVTGTAKQCTRHKPDNHIAVRSNLDLFAGSEFDTFCCWSERWLKLALRPAACKAR